MPFVIARVVLLTSFLLVDTHIIMVDEAPYPCRVPSADEQSQTLYKLLGLYDAAILHAPPDAVLYVAPDPVAGFRLSDFVWRGPPIGCLQCNEVILTVGASLKPEAAKLHLNRLGYAIKHKMCYINFTEAKVDPNTLEGKILKGMTRTYPKMPPILRMLEYHLIGDAWLLLMDLDTGFTNWNKTLGEVIAEVAEDMPLILNNGLQQPFAPGNPSFPFLNKEPTPSFVIAADGNCHLNALPINTGVMLMKNNEFVRRLIEDNLRHQHFQTEGFGNLQFCEQTVLTVLFERGYGADFRRLHEHCKANLQSPQIPGTGKAHLLYSLGNDQIAITHSRTMNSFDNEHHTPTIIFKWKPRDYIVHLAGVTKNQRVNVIDKVHRESDIDI